MDKMSLGGGGRFAALKAKLGKKPGVSNPGGLAAWIGKQKYGKAKMTKMAAVGKKRKMRPPAASPSTGSMDSY